MGLNDIAIKVNNITKVYPGVIALENISLEIKKGEVHALVGENGAGKSTFIKLLSGADIPESGTIEIDGDIYSSMSPAISRKLGIEVIYQEFTLIPSLSVAENICMGNYPGNRITIDFKEMEKRTLDVFKRMKVHIDPQTLVRDLSVAHMQLVEIAKALSRDVKILIMDEPTAPLTLNEVDILMDLVKNLRKQGTTIIYISHRMNEIYELSDKLTILRDGIKVGTYKIEEISRKELIRQMVGRDLSETFPEKYNKLGDVILEVRNIVSPKVNNISFTLRKGEILGVAGLVGAGRTELARLIFGADLMESGAIYLENEKVRIKNPVDAVKNGIGLVPEDRKQHGLILPLSIKENITLTILKEISKATVINTKKERMILERHTKSLRIKTPSFDQKVKNLSGGNQQKVVLSKWLARDCKVLIFDEPTRGIDVGAKQEIYFLLIELAKKGIGIIMISSEMEELIGISNRIMVLHEGDLVGTVFNNDFSQEKIMRLASGQEEKE